MKNEKVNIIRLIIGKAAAFLILLLLSPFLILVSIIIFSSSPKENIIFSQIRVGRNGALFKVYKFRTMTSYEPKEVTRIGRFLRKWKIDEIPMLINVLKGEMVWVGPRPDIPGYADKLEGENRKILSQYPGLTCEATLKYRNEEQLLEKQSDPLWYNDNVIWPDKVKINLEFINKQSFKEDIKIIAKTVYVIFFK
ncbi:MAG: sugar transferase [Bacteroidales bacterium]|nr:sugar transferase [Bacteroidales bacterium]